MRLRPFRVRDQGRPACAGRRTAFEFAMKEVNVLTETNNGQNTREIKRYAEMISRLAPRSSMARGLFRSFWVGGLICVIGQAITDFYNYGLNLGAQSASTATSITLIFLSALLTGLGIYDRIGKYAGAGSIVPITGFANSVVSPAMEFRREGLVMGVGAKLFTLAGPVLVYGISSSIIVGLIVFLIEMI